MNIEHVAFWVSDLEKMKDFYLRYFDLQSNEMYHNPKKNFSSYFLSFGSGARLELMHRPDISRGTQAGQSMLGITHLAISVGNKGKVNSLTEELRDNGYQILGEPRTTGDGYYESVILDPEGNQIEITS